MTKTWHIHITGLVQGIGFRPFVYKLAIQHGLFGWVKNDRDGLHIEINGTKKQAHRFYKLILATAPKLTSITGSQIIETPHFSYKLFEIIHDSNAQSDRINPTPDFATCAYCRAELMAPKDRRFQYPFITCSSCGPRYSIIVDWPYDRQRTKMRAFSMCDKCDTEYNDPRDRRYYAQTNSCASCGIKLNLYNSNKEIVSNDSDRIIKLISEKWNDGKIVAIKGIGGYLITCSANNVTAIKTLRSRKNRPNKPFAIMVPSIASASFLNTKDKEINALTDAISPIVLVTLSDRQGISDGICDGLSRIGIMTPYAPLFQLLLNEFSESVVATSGNISNAPIIFKDEKALDELLEIADYILVHDREMVVPQDDSVVTYTSYFKKRIIIRRSRGMAPSYFNSQLQLSNKSILSMGAYLKSTFAALQNGIVYISQYLGDLDNYDTQQNFQHTLVHLTALLEIKPEQIVVDLHSDYPSSIKGNLLSKEFKIPVLKVQHHIAHFSAIIGEHALIDTDARVLGVIWDGAGLGEDGHIWGGEFFTYSNYQFERSDHLPYFANVANDKMAKEPRLSALSLGHELKGTQSLLKAKFSEVEWNIYSQKLKNKNIIQTSSIGRLFDGVAAILNISDIQSYEGQAASLLQVQAEKYFDLTGIVYNESYFNSELSLTNLTKYLISKIIIDLKNEIEIPCIAAKFHLSLVHWIIHIARGEGANTIGFSGGVFQNTLLVDLIIHHLSAEYELLFHKDLSPNDENISFGQLIYAEIQAKRHKDSLT